MSFKIAIVDCNDGFSIQEHNKVNLAVLQKYVDSRRITKYPKECLKWDFSNMCVFVNQENNDKTENKDADVILASVNSEPIYGNAVITGNAMRNRDERFHFGLTDKEIEYLKKLFEKN